MEGRDEAYHPYPPNPYKRPRGSHSPRTRSEKRQRLEQANRAVRHRHPSDFNSDPDAEGDYDDKNDAENDDRDIDTTFAHVVNVPIRRKKNPGRQITVAQTQDVIERNRRRRERYRASLSAKKRADYDRNAAKAKGLIEDSD